VAKASGLLKELHEDKTVEGLARYENVQELLNAIKEYVDNPQNEDKSLSAFLQSVSLLTSADDDKDDKSEKVTLMTIHSAKGLEFKHVFIVGMEEDLFPSQMMLSSMADLEEERRLFYVAITRAEHKLTLSYAETRYRFGRLQSCEPSRFLKEIDPAYIKNATGSFEQERNTSFVKNLTTRKAPPLALNGHAPSANFVPSDTSALAAGMKVEHPKFGFGVVKAVDFSTPDKKAKIQFEQVGEKTLLLSFAKLMIH
jgi:DNA helicase-2/ATP-dependent DNA helicase PcrA